VYQQTIPVNDHIIVSGPILLFFCIVSPLSDRTLKPKMYVCSFVRFRDINVSFKKDAEHIRVQIIVNIKNEILLMNLLSLQ